MPIPPSDVTSHVSAWETVQAYARLLSAGAMVSVPRELVLSIEVSAAVARPDLAQNGLPQVDYSVKQLAKRYGRKESTIRQWCSAGQFPGAYKHMGKEYRVPLSGVIAFEEQQRKRSQTAKGLDLSEWREFKSTRKRVKYGAA